MENKAAFTQKRYKPSLPNIEFSIPKAAYAKLPGHIKRHFPKNRFAVAYLLTTDTAKAKKAQKRRWLNAVLYLTPSTKIGLPGVNLCGAESAPCRIACLDASGRLGRALGQRAMAARTLFLIFHQDLFARRLLHEVANLDGFCTRHGFKLALRLNGTSDRPFEAGKYQCLVQTIIESFPRARLYDYTKHFVRTTERYRNRHGIAAYHMTFSFSGTNWSLCRKVLHREINVAVPFAGPLPRRFRGHRVFDGDRHDLRFLDPTPRVVGLRFKRVLDGQGATLRPEDVPRFAVAS